MTEPEPSSAAPAGQDDPEAWGSGAAEYDDAFARYTARYAGDALALLGVGPGTSLLDVAAGSGAATLRAAALGASVLATDFSPAMIAVLRRNAAAAGIDSVDTAVMDAQALDVADGSFDAAISMFGLMFAPDLDRAGAELRRAVRPGGRAALAAWAGSGNRLNDLIGDAIGRVIALPEPPPPTWAELTMLDGMEAFLARAGFVDIAAHRVEHEWPFDDPRAFFRAVPSFAVPARPLFAALGPAQLDAAADAFADVVAERAARSGTTSVVVDAIVGIGTVAAS